MSTPWKPAIPITKELVVRILQNQLPDLPLTGLCHAGSGWDHDVWRCGEVLFRFPHQEESLVLAVKHTQTLKYLSPLLPVAIPTPLYKGVSTKDYAGCFVGYRWIEGSLPAYLTLTTEDRAALTMPLANVLRILHQLPRMTAMEWDINIPTREGELMLRSEHAQKRAEQLSDGPYANLAKQAALIMRTVPAEVSETHYCLIHGDLHAGQLLLCTDHRLTGIIDWDELTIWDPAYDLMLVYSMLPPSSHDLFWSHYGPFEGKHRARFVALSYGLAILAQAVAEGQQELAKEAAYGLNNALSCLPI